MAKKIIWSPQAIRSHTKIAEYLEQKWSLKEVESFTLATFRTIDLISSGTITFRRSQKRGIYEVLVTKHNLLLYRITKESIELLTFLIPGKIQRKSFLGNLSNNKSQFF